MNKVVNKLACFLIFISINGCISISKIENEYKNKDLESTKEAVLKKNISIYLVNSEAKNCIADYQKTFILNAINKYFAFTELSKINIRIKESLYSNIGWFGFNLVLSVFTYTIIPIYGSVSYDILITVQESDKKLIYKAFFIDEGLISVFAVPFMLLRELKEVRKNNLENAIYIASKSSPTQENLLTTMPADMTPECSYSLADYFRRQKW